MKLSELIKMATKAMADHGDIEVTVSDLGCRCCSASEAQQANADVDFGPVEIKKDGGWRTALETHFHVS